MDEFVLAQGLSEASRYGANARLGAIAKAPFFAVPISPALPGTKGSLEVNADAFVIGRDRKAIDGPCACGDIASSIMGFGHAGARASIGPAMSFAFLAEEDISRMRGKTMGCLSSRWPH